jgi:hypothetical protein
MSIHMVFHNRIAEQFACLAFRIRPAACPWSCCTIIAHVVHNINQELIAFNLAEQTAKASRPTCDSALNRYFLAGTSEGGFYVHDTTFQVFLGDRLFFVGLVAGQVV